MRDFCVHLCDELEVDVDDGADGWEDDGGRPFDNPDYIPPDDTDTDDDEVDDWQ